MSRIIALASLVCIFVWILPLGAFIKPSQEKTACGGKRAFHMCSMGKKVPSGRVAADGWSAAGERGSQKAAAGSSDDMLLAAAVFPVRRDVVFPPVSSPAIFYGFSSEIPAPPPRPLVLS